MNVHVRLFGALSIRTGAKPVRLGVAGATRDLLAYCLTHPGREIRREQLCDIFWGDSDPERARSALNSAVYRLRRALVDLPGAVLHSNGERLRLDLGPAIRIDVIELADAMQALAAGDEDAERAAAPRLSLALKEAREPFLAGSFRTWALVERERLTNLRMRGLAALMRIFGRARDYEDALSCGRELLEEDPFREAAQCEVMWLYVLNGQRAQALRQYRAYQDLLRRELGVAPMAETQALHRHVLEDFDAAGLGETAAGRRGMGETLSAIERSRRDLYATLHAQHVS